MEEYGFDRYEYTADGSRRMIGQIRTLRPEAGETNGAFEQRVDTIVRALCQPDLCVQIRMERRAGAIVQCQIEIDHPARPAPVQRDERTSGGRPLSWGRGARGG